MKSDRIVWLLGLLFGGLFLFSCDSSHENMLPEIPASPRYHEEDSLACVKMYQEMSGSRWQSAAIWDLKDIATWRGIQWSLIEENGVKTYRVVGLDCEIRDRIKISLSSHIGTFKYLSSLRLVGEGLVGNIPSFINDFNLTWLVIGKTGLQGHLPDKLFNENMTLVQIYDNPSITGPLPSSVTSLKSTISPKRLFMIRENGLTGKVPPITQARIYLQSNQFTSIDEECFKGYEKDLRGVYVEDNQIKVTLSDEILTDTFKLYIATIYMGLQKKGQEGIINLPYSREKIYSNFLKWQETHSGEMKF